MNLAEFKSTLKRDDPPAAFTPVLTALWYAGKNDWERAHRIAQDVETKEGYWVHAYLHRQEGDQGNARLWQAPLV